MKASDGRLDDLAGAILDGTPIDWSAAESRSDDAANPLITELKMLAAIADWHRSPAAAPAPPRWGHLELLDHVGSGAYGEVYRAWDTRLDREVALKLLSRATHEQDRASSAIIHEGRLLARVRHPNVAAVYDADEISGRIGLWMEFVRGETLERILQQHGPLSAAETAGIGVELCRAVSAVHGAGVLHRDIKAHNVVRAKDGRIVLMDFGTGRELHDDAASDLAGTPLYLAPEVLEGQPATIRSDIYSLGVLLYHLVTNSYPVQRSTVRELRRAHESGERITVRDARADVPSELARIIDRAIEFQPNRRYASADALVADLAALQPRPAVPLSPRAAFGMRVPLAMLAGALVAIPASVWLLDGRAKGIPAPRLQNPFQVTSTLDVESYPSWSPDGRRVAYQASELGYYYVGNHDIWVAQIGSGEPVNLTKGHPANDRMPSWSPDGREIAFFSDRTGDWGLYTVAATGGTPRQILSLAGIGNASWGAPQWSRDGTNILVCVRQAGENVVIVLSLATSDTTRIVLPSHQGNVCWDMSVSPDGRRFAYIEGASGQTEVTRLWTVRASGEDAVPLTDGRTNVWSPTWAADGRTLFYVSNRGRSMDLWEQMLAGDGTPVGEPVAVTQGLGIRSASFSPDGSKLAYTRGARVGNVWRVPILSDRPAIWTDAMQLTSDRALVEFIDVSPGGEWLAVSSDRRGNQDIWLLPATGGEMTPLATDPTPDWAPRWSPDGSEIAFYSYRSGNRDIWIAPARGGNPRQLTANPAQDRNPRWSPDGRHILFHSNRPEGRGNWILDATGGQERLLMRSEDGGDDGGDWSPDGQWLVLSRESRLYRVAATGSEASLLSSPPERPFSPRFSRDGRAIYYSNITGPRESHDLWKLSLADGSISRLTKLEGRRGRLGYFFAADAQYLYLTWNEDDGDIWIMDVVAGRE